MNRTELVAQVAIRSGASQAVVSKVIGETLDAIAESIASGDKVTLVGFGSFERKLRKGRKGVNPKTGEAVEIPAKNVPVFSAGKLLKEQVA